MIGRYICAYSFIAKMQNQQLQKHNKRALELLGV